MKTGAVKKNEKVTWGDVFPKCRISIIDNGRIKKARIEGAKKLLLCIEKEVKISLGEEVFHATGKELSCISYASGAVEVLGNIERIEFEEKGVQKEKKG